MKATPTPFISAVDIGYSSVKCVFGLKGDDPTSELRPAGAGPISVMSGQVGRGAADYLTVQVAGESWAAGVEPTRLDGWARELHADYPASAAYKALYYAALLMTGVDRIDHLVTGLPVSQANDAARVKALQDSLQGKHVITPKRTVEVAEISVLPQPVGAFIDYLNQEGTDAEAYEDARVLVIDPGFFSVDWVVIDAGELRNSLAGTSTSAMSQVIEEADKAISVDYGSAIGRDKIEKAIRCGTSVLVSGKSVDPVAYLTTAVKHVAHQALTAMRQQLRTDSRPFDAVLLTGGGAQFYATAAAEVFPKAKILRPTETVSANARGFWRYASE